MLYVILLCFLTLQVLAEEDCSDKSPYCNTNDCTVRPGYAREYCKKSCGNCTEQCHNSHFVSCKEERKSECDSMLKDYCPLLCGVCKPIKKKYKKQSKSKAVVPTSTSTVTVIPFMTTKIPIIPSTANASRIAEQSRTVEPYIMPPMFRNNDLELRRSPSRHRQLISNAIDETPAEPLNIDEESEVEWVHAPDVTSPPPSRLNFTRFMPELPEPQPIQYPRQPANPIGNNGFNQYQGNLPQPAWNRGFTGYGSFPQPQTTYGHSYTQYGIRRKPTQAAPNYSINNNNNNNHNHINGMAGDPSSVVSPSAGFLNNQHGQFAMNSFNRPIQSQRNHFPRETPLLPTAHQQYPYESHPYGSYAMPPRNINNNNNENKMPLADLIALLGCRDRDPSTCSKITEETCYSRPGFYLKLCPVKCKNCNGLQCFDSIKVDCEEVHRMGGCRLPSAAEYCPRTCQLCPPPPALADSLSVCKDELDTCEQLAGSGVCQHPHSREALRMYCAKSCGFCKQPQYYLDDTNYYKSRTKKSKSSEAKAKKRQ